MFADSSQVAEIVTPAGAGVTRMTSNSRLKPWSTQSGDMSSIVDGVCVPSLSTRCAKHTVAPAGATQAPFTSAQAGIGVVVSRAILSSYS